MDASWIWTEPHSRRLKVKLTVQKEVGNGAVLQQAMTVTFVVRNQQCDTCAAAFTNNTWTAVVQVRQRVDHKRTFFYLEQLILKHSAHSQCTNIQVRVVRPIAWPRKSSGAALPPIPAVSKRVGKLERTNMKVQVNC